MSFPILGWLTRIWLLLAASSLAWSQTYNLLPRYQVGQSWIAREVYFVELRSEALPGGVQQHSEETESTQVITAIAVDGMVECQVTINRAEPDNTPIWLKQKHLGRSKLNGLRFAIVLDPSGEVIEVRPPENMTPEIEPLFNILKQVYLNYSKMTSAPDEPVAVGGSWDKELAFTLDWDDKTQHSTYNLNSRLSGLRKYQGIDCFEIQFEGDFHTTVDFGVPGTMQGKLKGYRLVDRQSGLPVKMEMKIDRATSKMLFPEGEMVLELNMSHTKEFFEANAIR